MSSWFMFLLVAKRNTSSDDWNCGQNNISKRDTARKRPNSVQDKPRYPQEHREELSFSLGDGKMHSQTTCSHPTLDAPQSKDTRQDAKRPNFLLQQSISSKDLEQPVNRELSKE